MSQIATDERETKMVKLSANLLLHRRSRQGFTLVELLVVIGVMIALLSITLMAFSAVMDGEETGAGARQLQSYLAGARDRAIYARAPRGIRLMIDAEVDGGFAASSAVYIGAPEPWTEGEYVQLERAQDPTSNLAGGGTSLSGDFVRTVRGFDTLWHVLIQRGLLTEGSRIKIPATKSGTWYSVQFPRDSGGNLHYRQTYNNPTSPNHGRPSQVLWLTTPYRSDAETPSGQAIAFDQSIFSYELEIPATILPNQEPMLLPEGAVVDLAASKIPRSWYTSAGTLVQNLDVVFSPRGTVRGALAAEGVLHFCVTTTDDAIQFNEKRDALIQANPSLRFRRLVPAETYAFSGADFEDANGISRAETGTRASVSVFTQTGRVSTHPIDATDSDNDDFADDPFKFAREGKVGGE